ncbi:MAG: hypothetical protein BGO67_09855 [Alphaproteobacteria bacterium 41-28]|nr:MAG: hypothetical protein BGO67_09855 [Alphaproteobacteria bacterium 41-28]
MKSIFHIKAIICLSTWVSFLIFLYAACYSASFKKMWNLSKENLFFVGREGKLQEINSFFRKGDGDILALTGGPGFGKSQIAKKYAYHFQNNYSLVWWIDAQQDIPSQFEKLALALNHLLSKEEEIIPSMLAKEALIDRVKDVLRIKNIPYLLIFDNADTYGQVEKYIPSTHQQNGKHILLTSRYANIWTDKVEIGEFKRPESICLIKKMLPKENNEDVHRLAATLSDYPLGLTMATGFIKNTPTVTIDKFLSVHMKKTLSKNEKKTCNVLDNYTKNAQATLAISLKSIAEDSQDALKALLFMSLLNSKDIPETYIEIWLKKIKSPLTADEAIRYVYEQSLVGVSETTKFNDKRTPKETERMHYLSLHDLIHQLINEQIPMEEKKDLIEKATTVMLEVFSGTVEDFVKKILDEPTHLLHAQKLCENAKQIGYKSSNLLKLKVCIFQCFVAPLRNFESAADYLKEIEEDLDFGLELKPYYKAIFKISNGALECIYNVNYDEAIRNMEEGLALLDTFKDYDDGKLRAIANLAQYYSLRGEPVIAEKIINKGKQIFNNSTSDEYKTFYIWTWSLVLTDQGRYEEAIRVLDMAKGLPHSFPVFEQGLLQQRTFSLIKLGKIEEASKILKQFEKAIRKFFKGKSKMASGSILEYKSYILIYKQKNIPAALNYLAQSLKEYKEFFRHDKKHRLQGRAHLAMGKAYKVKKDFQTALKEYRLSEEIYNLVLKEKKIDDVSDLYKELAILGAEIKDEALVHKYLKAHIDTFGKMHPRTKEILLYLDQNRLTVPF